MSKDNPHGEAELTPSEYELRLMFDASPTVPRQYLDDKYLRWIDDQKERLRERSSSVYSPVGQCAHCGNWIRYHVVMYHEPTDSLIAVGRDCAHNRFGRSDEEWSEYKDRLDRMRLKAAKMEKRASVKERFPKAAELLEQCLEDREEIAEETGYTYYPSEHYRMPDDFQDRWPQFVFDVAWMSYRHGRLTENQAEAVVDAVPEHRERRRKWREERESRPPVPEGRRLVEGEIIKIDERQNDWGTRLVCTVRSDQGWAVWGTLPQALLHAEVGDRVRFSAEIERSNDDESFGFYNRPTKAEHLEKD